MTIKPILFKPEMVRAICLGRKTQTRRVVCSAHEDPIIKYRQGDLLWVRETFCWGSDGEPGAQDFVIYRANYAGPEEKLFRPWTPSIFMPRRASRITLEVTNVRAQRLQQISPIDSIAEGVECAICADTGMKNCKNGCFAAVASFRDLWDSINAKRGFGWESNPWVAALEFRAHATNVDTLNTES